MKTKQKKAKINDLKVIEVNSVSKIYKNEKETVAALKDIDFNLGYGDDLAIVGPSGSGKTTLLQIMGGLSDPSHGEVLIDGMKVNTGNDNSISEFRNQKMGFVFQNIYLQDYFTALENVMLPMLIAGKSKKIAKDRAEELLTMVGLKDRMHYKPSKLSGGEEQRVAIARALSNSPKILFAYEPTAKLDASNSKLVVNLLKEINKTGVSIIVITHDEQVASYFSKKLYLDHGSVTSINF